MAAVFKHLEPYANSLLDQDLPDAFPRSAEASSSKNCIFGGLYQEIVATRFA
jgi:hypothetical protein